jgi:hypothetical protein
MATSYGFAGPRIVRDGLQLYLDASNPNSFNAGKTTWKDISTNTSTDAAQLVNNPVFATNNFTFNGSNTVIIIPELSRLNTQTLTIESWVNIPSLSQNGFIFEKGNVNTQYSLFFDAGTLIYFRQSIGGGNADLTVSTNSISINTWNHIVGTFTNGNRRIYINSILAASDTQAGTISTNTNGCSIGAYGGFNGGRNYYLNGSISAIRIYNRPLSPTEIYTNYKTQAASVFGRFADGSLAYPFISPYQAQELGATSGNTYYFRAGRMTAARQMEYRSNYYDNKPFCCTFRSAYASTATVNEIGLNIPMQGLLVQRDALDHRAAVYFNTFQQYNAVSSLAADSGYAYRRVHLGSSGAHGIYNNTQNPCNWGDSIGAIGAGWDGGTCGSFPNDLKWGTGVSSTPVYTNRSGTWSHWVTWGET